MKIIKGIISIILLTIICTLLLSYTVDAKQKKKPTYYDCTLSKKEQRYIKKQCKKNNISFKIVMQVIAVESDFQKNLKSKTGDNGLMQINNVNKVYLEETLNINNLMDFKQNVKSGCHLLGELKKKHKNYHQVLMAYNFGESGAKAHWKKGTYQSAYSRKVLSTKLKKI